MGYTDRQEALRCEAMRTVPGVLAAKHRDDVEGAARLIDGFFTTATNFGITNGAAWSILWSATLHWTMEIADSLAEHGETNLEELLQGMGRNAASWMSEERGVGGY